MNGSSRLVTLFSWLVIGAMLVGLWRFTTLGADTRPTLLSCEGANCAASSEVPLVRAPAAPLLSCVSARLDGVDALFLLDTGTGDTVLDQSVLAQRGTQGRARNVLGAVNEEFGFQPLVPVARLELGSLRYGNFEAPAVDLSPVSAALGVELTGILGMNVLGQTAFEIDFRAMRLVLDATRGGPVARKVAEARDAFPLRDVAGGLFAEVRSGATSGLFLIDSGAAQTQLEADLAKAAGVGPGAVRRSVVVAATGVREGAVTSVVLPEVVLGQVQRAGLRADLGDANLLGADFLERSLLRIDARALRATLAPSSEPGRPTSR